MQQKIIDFWGFWEHWMKTKINVFLWNSCMFDTKYCVLYFLFLFPGFQWIECVRACTQSYDFFSKKQQNSLKLFKDLYMLFRMNEMKISCICLKLSYIVCLCEAYTQYFAFVQSLDDAQNPTNELWKVWKINSICMNVECTQLSSHTHSSFQFVSVCMCLLIEFRNVE